MKLHAIGTGGGRFCMIRQMRRTGGFIVEAEDTRLHVDPAPGALVYSLQDGHDPSNLDGVFVSHAHLDHCGDLAVIVEAMTDGCTTETGTLIANSTSLHGAEDIDPALDTYHREAVDSVVEVDEGDQYDLDGLHLTFHTTRHKDIETTGFLMEADGHTLGYIPDTELFDGLKEMYAPADILVLNVLRPHDREWKGHLNLADALEIVDVVDPDRAFIQHFGMNFLQSFRDELDWLNENRGGHDITLVSDGTTYSMDEEGIEQFV